MKPGPTVAAAEDVPSERAPEDDFVTGTSVYLHPGRLFVSSVPAQVTTILGSCVAVCVWDPVLRLGGTNHYLLPHWVGYGISSPRFGNVAVHQLIEELRGLGSRKSDLQGKIFGGACVIDAFGKSAQHLGAKNVEVGLKVLQQEGIPVVASDVGGRRGRKVIFYTDSGVVLVRLM